MVPICALSPPTSKHGLLFGHSENGNPFCLLTGSHRDLFSRTKPVRKRCILVSWGMSSSCTSTRHVAFFYGTLKYKFPNWAVVPPTVIFLGTARTLRPYPLVVDTEMGVPYILPLPGHPHAQSIHGELYSMTSEEAEALDRFEGVHIDFYFRAKLDVVVTASGDGRTPQPNPVDGQLLKPGSVLPSQTYFRGKGGASWAQKWSVERLQTLPMKSMYTIQDVEGYIPQLKRPKG